MKVLYKSPCQDSQSLHWIPKKIKKRDKDIFLYIKKEKNVKFLYPFGKAVFQSLTSLKDKQNIIYKKDIKN